ncbi:hypothetical protein CEXT_457351 [Caerostris extrusa]|uniref:Uncharacterized protein n=1 Tax=Caerostris extrusa TaxID=172846 RepID=A0AAV4WAR5_CAEEX|nr:hypothetical protein CEXT_457351 [Caerostris extrusa]
MSSPGHHHQPTIPESRQPPSAMDFIESSGGCTIRGIRSRPPHPFFPTGESFVCLGHHQQPTIPESRQPPSAMDFIGSFGGCTICGTRSRPPHPPTRESFVWSVTDR